MKQNILFIFLFLFTISLNAQIIEVGEVTYEEFFTVDLTDNWTEPIVEGKVTNLTNDVFLLKWELEMPVDGPAEWEYRVFDGNQCYSSQVVSNIDASIGLDVPAEIQPGDTRSIDLHILPRMVSGTCIAKIHLSSVNDPDNILETAEFIVHIQGLTSTTEAEKAAVKLYPNPVTDYFLLNQSDVVDRIVMYNIIGKPVRTFAARNGEQYNISDLPNGMYLASLIDSDNDIIKTVRVTKNSIRP